MSRIPSRRLGGGWLPDPLVIRARLLSRVVSPTPPSFALGLVVGACLIAAETVVVVVLQRVVGQSLGGFGLCYMFGVLVVSAVWGVRLSLTMTLASAIAFGFFHAQPYSYFGPFTVDDWLAIGVFLVVALLANSIAAHARVGERFFALSSDLLCIAAPDNVIRVNPAFKRILGYSDDEIASRPWIDFVVPDDREQVRAVFGQLAGSSEPVQYANRVICRDGTHRYIEWSVVWFRGTFYVVGRDVSERHTKEDQLRSAQGVAEARGDQLRTLAEQQASLRRVATLVALGGSPSEVFAAVAEEMVNCLHVDNAGVQRYEADGTLTIVSVHLAPGVDIESLLGSRWPLEGNDPPSVVFRTGRAARDNADKPPVGPIATYAYRLGFRCAVGVPVVVNGKLWGCAAVASLKPEPLPLDTEERVGDFTDLVATAIANAATRDELQASGDNFSVLAEQQAALRRVATLVARGISPSEVFAAVTEEMRRCLHTITAGLWRYDPTGEITLIASASEEPAMLAKWPVGTQTPIEGNTLASAVLRTGRAARMDSYEEAPGSVAARVRDVGVRAAVGVPVIVGGSLWGLAGVGSVEPGPLPGDTEARLGDFAELVATAIANAEARDELIATRDELIASRARIVAAAEDARRRLERDLHDGAQQRLVSLGLELRLAESSVPPELQALQEQLSGLVSGLSALSSELQEISRGIHPAILSDGGLGPALKTLARRCPISANIDVHVEGRLPESIEVAAYYVVAEALTNAAKYSQATDVKVCAEIKEGNLCLSVQDDGIGGADSCNGSGLIGLKDRVEVLGGHMNVISPPGVGTTLHATIPLTG